MLEIVVQVAIAAMGAVVLSVNTVLFWSDLSYIYVSMIILSQWLVANDNNIHFILK